NDTDVFEAALAAFASTRDRPTFIILDSHIAYGAPHKQDTSAAHGEPLGEDEVRLAKGKYGWPEDAKFLVPDEVRTRFRDGIQRRGRALHAEWNRRFEAYRRRYPGPAAELVTLARAELPAGWDGDLRP